MGLRDILVVVDDKDAAAGRVAYAAALADRHGAHLTGLFVTPPLEIPTYVMAQLPAEAHRVRAEDDDRKAEAACLMFEQQVAGAGLASRSEWVRESGISVERTARLGRLSDLVVVGQSDPENPLAGGVDVAELVLSGGRPVLVVPYALRQPKLGEHILIAWNDSREAARAVADAMPILEAANNVSVLSVDPRKALGDTPGADIATHLARHDISVESASMDSRELSPADILLNRASDLSADMIVMGAYGRSRLRELVLGGVTYDILQRMTVPVLMSH